MSRDGKASFAMVMTNSMTEAEEGCRLCSACSYRAGAVMAAVEQAVSAGRDGSPRAAPPAT